jgi:hypothetical protein
MQRSISPKFSEQLLRQFYFVLTGSRHGVYGFKARPMVLCTSRVQRNFVGETVIILPTFHARFFVQKLRI